MFKRLLALLALAFLVGGPISPAPVAAESEAGDITNKPAQAINFTSGVDTGRYRGVSAVAVYADGTPVAHTVADGRKSTAKLTVRSLTNLSTSYATIQINVNHNGFPAGTTILLNNQRIVAGRDFAIGTVSSMTAYNIAAALHAYEMFNSSHAGTATLVIATATVVGIAPNSWAASVDSSSITFSAATFTGGNDAASITINGVTLTNGVQWFVGASTTTTAADISRAIINSSMTSLVISTVTGNVADQGGIVFATATFVGAGQYIVSASTPTALSWSFPYLINGSTSDINVSDDSITKTSHGITTGLRVAILQNGVAGTIPTGLTLGTTYYGVFVNDNQYKLATSSMNAVAGTAVDITALIGGGSLTLTPTPLTSGVGTGLGSFKWQASNDNSNWADLSVSSVTWSAAGSSAWDFGDFNYRYLRLNFVGPINGGIRLNTHLSGKVDR